MALKDLVKNIKLFSHNKAEKTEVKDGYLIERRSVLWLPVLAATTLVSPSNFFASEKPISKTSGEMIWDDFLKECLPKASELYKHSSAKGQDSYLLWIASMATRLDLKTIPKAKLGKFKNVEPPARFGVEYRGKPFFVVEWKMSPNMTFPAHNHPSGSVCTVGISGEARIRNFEVHGDAPEFASTKQFYVKETKNQLLTEGRINTLSMTRDNIHMFEVGSKGASGIDITTLHSKYNGFSFLDIQNKPLNSTEKIFEANWKKL